MLNADNQVTIDSDLTGLNLFTYCENNPVMNFDPSGEYFEKIGEFFSGIWNGLWNLREHNLEEAEKIKIQTAIDQTNTEAE